MEATARGSGAQEVCMALPKRDRCALPKRDPVALPKALPKRDPVLYGTREHHSGRAPLREAQGQHDSHGSTYTAETPWLGAPMS